MRLETFISIYAFRTGRRLYAVRRVRDAARSLEFEGLVSLCGEALEHDQQTQDLEARWRVARSSKSDPRTASVDNQIDRILGSMDRTLTEVPQLYGLTSEEATIAARIQTRLLPGGAGNVTRLAFVEEHEAVNRLLRLSTGELSEDVRRVGLEPAFQRLTTLNTEFGQLLSKRGAAAAVDFGTVKAARAEGQNYVLRCIAVALGRFNADDDESVQARQALLQPIVEQNEQIGAYLSRRRPVPDIDPATGEEVPEEAADDAATLTG